MKQIKLLPVVLAVMLLAPAPQAGEKLDGCSGQIQECLDAMVKSLRNRGWVGLELDSDHGLEDMTVSRVLPGSPAEAAGFREGDRLVALNGVDFLQANIGKLHKMRDNLRPGTQVTYRVQRKGSVRELWVTLAAVPDAVMAEWVGRHMLEHAHTGDEGD